MGIISQAPNLTPARAARSRLKLHLRLLTLGDYTYRLLTLRPETRIAFSTNFYHQTWHIVTSQRGAHLLARLLWGLAYERHPGTMLMIHGGHLLPTPFEGERSDPFLLAPAGLTRPTSVPSKAAWDGWALRPGRSAGIPSALTWHCGINRTIPRAVRRQR